MISVGCVNDQPAGVCREVCMAVQRTVARDLWHGCWRGGWRMCADSFPLEPLPGMHVCSGPCSFTITTSLPQFTVVYMTALVVHAKHCLKLSCGFFLED